MTSRLQNGRFTYSCVSLAICAATAIATAIAMLATPAAQAAEWRIEPLVRAGADYDDNAILTPRTDLDSDISGYIIDLKAKFAYASETSKFFITPTLRTRDYDKPEYDADDQFLDFRLDHDTQSSTFAFRGNYSRESVRTAERSDADLDIEDPDEIPDDDTARVASAARRQLFRLSPSWSYRMSDASSIVAALAYTDTSYDEVIGNRYTDYSDARANLSYRRVWSPRNTAILTGFYRQYESDGSDPVDGFGFNAGFERTLSETMRIRALVGVENTETTPTETESNWVADLSLTRRLQTITMLAQYRRSISGGGSGSLNSRDQFNLNFVRQLNERASAGLGVRAYQTNALIKGNTNFDERDYVQLRAQFTWKMTPRWSVETNYRYTFSDRSSLGESANSNQVTVWLNYRPTPIIRSR